MKTFTLEKFVRSVLILGGIALCIIILYNYGTIFGYAIAAMLLSYILDPIVNRIQSWGLNRTVAIALTLSTVILVLVFISTSIIPIIGSEMIALTSQLDVDKLQEIARKIEERLVQRYTFIPDMFLQDNITKGINEVLDLGKLSTVVSDVIDVFTNVFSAFLVIPFATFFFLKDGTKIRRDLLRLVPNKYFETSLSLLDKIEKRLSIYFKSVLFQSFLVATFSYIYLSLAGLDNALSVGIAVGVANTIPYFGPILGYVLSAIVSILETGDFSITGFCLLAILGVQIMDNVIFQPLIFSKSADIHPVAILFIILIGAQTGGILGMLVAIPIATTIKITINQLNWSVKNYRVFKSEVSSVN